MSEENKDQEKGFNNTCNKKKNLVSRTMAIISFSAILFTLFHGMFYLEGEAPQIVETSVNLLFLTVLSYIGRRGVQDFSEKMNNNRNSRV